MCSIYNLYPSSFIRICSVSLGSLCAPALRIVHPRSGFCKGSLSQKMVKVLNVAEKNDAAKNLADIMSRGGAIRREGFSKFNKIYEYQLALRGQQCHMIMTSVSGHLLGYEFYGSYRKWYGCNPLDLFDAPVRKACPENMEPIKKTLEREARASKWLIIWTDCDREGENIGFEIIDVCKAIKPSLQVFRAKFSEITHQSVQRALNTLGEPDRRLNDAVDVRTELDLRIGAAFTRFQTLRLQKVFPEKLADCLISYGSCQFPTLGFVVERYKAIEQFVPESFWKIKVAHEGEEGVIDFSWNRVRLFDSLACQVLWEKCQDNPTAKVMKVVTKQKSKWRPLPLDTVEFEKLASRKLKISAKEAMRIAEGLYTNGYISYPRTETNIFPKELSLAPLVEMQTGDSNWGDFASQVLLNGINPRRGKKTDEAHPPIHPTKYSSNLTGNEQTIYEFIVRHFLACISKDALGLETIVEIEISEERFTASGLIILERNYLEVYPYDRWSDKVMPKYVENETFEPTSIEMVGGETSPPSLLTEADLISLMEKHGIGTDATHAEHIEKIKTRMYVGLNESKFVPGQLGMGLVEGYDAMGFHMSKPNLRADLEVGLKRISEGLRNPEDVLQEQIELYRNVFQEALTQASKIDAALSHYLNEAPVEVSEENVQQNISNVCKCPNCGMDIVLKTRQNGSGYYLSCQGYPECKAVIWLPKSVVCVTVLEEHCLQCPDKPKKLKFTFARRAYSPYYPDEFVACIGGCDEHFVDTIDIKPLSKLGSTTQRQGSLPLSQNSSRPSGNHITSSAGRPASSSTKFSNASKCTTVSAANPQSSSSSQSSHPPPPPPPSWGRSAAAVPISQGNPTRRNQRMPSLSDDSGFSSHGSGSSRYSRTGASQELSSSAIVCDCNEDAILLTVRKEGPNTGRPFYKCAKPAGTGCNFFLWADDGSSTRTADHHHNTSLPPSALHITSDEVLCNCGIAAKRLTVYKEGPNKGREFYCCSKLRQEQCRFFKWADEIDDTSTASNSNNGTSIHRPPTSGSHYQSRKTASKRKLGGGCSEGPRKRKCGLCGREGHNRTKCPQKDF